MRQRLILVVLTAAMAMACSENKKVDDTPDAAVKRDSNDPAADWNTADSRSADHPEVGLKVDGPWVDGPRVDGPRSDQRAFDLSNPDSTQPQDMPVAPDTVRAVCANNIPETVHPGSPFVYVRPVASPTMHLLDFRALREVSGGFLEAFLEVDECARISATELVMDDHRVEYDQTGEPTAVRPWQTYELVENQGAGLYAWDKDTRTAALFDTQTAVAPSWTRVLVGQSAQGSPIGSGGFMATLWNGSRAADYTWDSLTIQGYEKNGYLVRATTTGGIQWHRKVENGSASVLAVDDGGTSLVQIYRGTTTDAVLFDGTEVLPPQSGVFDCSFVYLDPTGAIIWIKAPPSCSTNWADFALSSTTQDIYFTARANLDWGLGPHSSTYDAWALTKLDGSTGSALWHKAAGVGSTRAPDVVVAKSGGPVVTGYFKGTLTLGTTSVSSIAHGGRYFASLEENGDLRWLTAAIECSSAGGVDSNTPLSRIHDKVAIGTNLTSCTLQGHTVGATVGGYYVYTTNLFVMTP